MNELRTLDSYIYLTTGHQLKVLQVPETQNVHPWIFLLNSVASVVCCFVLFCFFFYLVVPSLTQLSQQRADFDHWLCAVPGALCTTSSFYNLHAKQILNLLSFFTIAVTIVLFYTFIIFHLDYPNGFLYCLPMARLNFLKFLITAV